MAKVKVGLALAGGGVRGSAHLGIVKALYEEKIYPEIFTGTSAGSICASMLAFGYSPERALKEFEAISKKMIDIAYMYLLKHALSPTHIEGFAYGAVLEVKLESLFRHNPITKVYPPLGIITTDIDKGKQVIFSNMLDSQIDKTKINDDDYVWLSDEKYLLSDAVRASSSMPPVFIPKVIDGMKLVDGGVTNNLPSDIAVALGADKVISIDLGFAGGAKTEGIIDIAHEAINILMSRVVDGNRNDFGLLLNPQVFDVSALQVEKIQECFDRGYTYGKSQIDNIVKYLEGW